MSDLQLRGHRLQFISV